MKKTNSYLTIGIAAGLFTATLVGLGIASYVRSRRRSKRIVTSDTTEINSPQYTKGYAEDITVV